MKKNILIIFLFFILFYTCDYEDDKKDNDNKNPKVKNNFVFNKYSNNPVLDIGDKDDFDSVHVRSPSVIFDDGIYKMWYSGYDGARYRIGYATSKDGINWNKHPESVLDFDDEEDVIYLYYCTVIKDSKNYKMWYTGYKGNKKNSIYYATSQDGINWEKWKENNKNKSVLEFRGGHFDSVYVFSPCVIKDKNKYIMYYTGYDDNHFRIGYAFSPNGYTWNRFDEPILDISVKGKIDSYHSHFPWVVKDKNIYYMWFSGNDGYNVRIGMVYSTDNINYDNYINEHMAVLDLGISGEWDDSGVMNSCAIKENGKYKIWYSGFDGTTVKIGYAFEK